MAIKGFLIIVGFSEGEARAPSDLTRAALVTREGE